MRAMRNGPTVEHLTDTGLPRSNYADSPKNQPEALFGAT